MIAKEGARLIIPAMIIAILAMYLGNRFDSLALKMLFWIALFGCAFSVYFFRDPERITPENPKTLIAPADGQVVEICEIEDPFVGRGRKIAIFMSPFNVHINRAPYAGIVRQIEHKKGKFLAAFKPEAGFENEQCRMTIETPTLKVAVTQIAGFFARRIVSRVAIGQTLTRGERFGLIMFGSRVEVIVPHNLKVTVAIGIKVKAGETIIGELT